MTISFNISADGATLYCIAERADVYWGHKLLVKIFNASGEMIGSISFACHAKDENFEVCQACDTAKLAKDAARQLNAGLLGSDIWRAFDAGLQIFVKSEAGHAPA